MCKTVLKNSCKTVEGFTTSKVSLFGFFLIRIFLHSDWIRRDTEYLFVFSPNAEKVDQKNSEYGHFSRIELRLRLGWRYTLKLLTTLPVKQNAMLTWGLVNTCHLTYQWLQKIRVHHEKNLQLKITFFVANLQGNYMIFQFFVAKPINLVF